MGAHESPFMFRPVKPLIYLESIFIVFLENLMVRGKVTDPQCF